ncbi:MAG: tetratricopeptide repeat protein, partial [Kiloniellales bacterium]
MIRSFLLRWMPAVALLAAAQAAWAQSYDEGMAAYDAGDNVKARDIWAPLAAEGDAAAQYSLGKLLENGGKGIQRDYPRAAEWYRKSAAQGIAAAQNNLGLMYAQGRGVARDAVRAAELWLVAGQKNHPIAQYNLALAYYRSDGLAEDKAKAEHWFRRAAQLGLSDAQYALGQVLSQGLT